MKDKGDEFKRLIIIKRYGKLSESEKFELNELNTLHIRIIKEFINTIDLNHFLDVFKFIERYIEVYDKYKQLKGIEYDNEDVEVVKEEEDKVTKASAKFNSVKYDLITEMQNILFLVNHEFKDTDEK